MHVSPFHLQAMHLSLTHRASATGLARRIRFDASAAAFASLASGVLALILFQACSIGIYDEPAWKLARMAAALVLGPGVLQPDDEFSATIVAAGVVVHIALALLFGVTIAFAAAQARDGFAPWIGLACGAALYALDLHGATRVYPWFAEMRTADTFMAHLLFGIAAATGYRHLAAHHRD